MLHSISIRNFGLIDQLELSLNEGLVCLTGETGTGKSMLVDAVLAALGARSDVEKIRTGTDTAKIGLFFGLSAYECEKLKKLGLDLPDRELLLVRELPREGRSRLWANGNTISQAVAREIGEFLVENIGQHEGQALLRPDTHLDYLDLIGGLMEMRSIYQQALQEWRSADNALKHYIADETARHREHEHLTRDLEEIEVAHLTSGEDTHLLARRQVLKSSGAISEAVNSALISLSDEESGAQVRITEAFKMVSSALDLDNRLESCHQSLEEIKDLLADVLHEISIYTEKLTFSPNELESIEERLVTIERLEKRFGDSVDIILAYAEQARNRIAELELSEVGKEELESILLEKQRLLIESAVRLHEARIKAAASLADNVEKELADLAMNRSHFSARPLLRESSSSELVWLGKHLNPDDRGIDDLEFQFSANPGEPEKPLTRVASGGELSRLMLALKTVAANQDRIETLVFDEVDVGIGGNTAHVVGERLRLLSNMRQVIVITHLPQIAARARQLIAVEKEESAGRTVVRIKTLTGADREDEIARMLGGGHPPTPTTLAMARELLAKSDSHQP